MILGASRDMDPKSRDIVTRKMIEGFTDLCGRAGVDVTGGQTVMNPWPIIGGTAMSVCAPSDFIMPTGAVPGDVLILTKPLGTQIAVNVNEWRQQEDKTNWNKAQGVITLEEAFEAYDKCCESMTRLNKNAAKLMHKYHAHGATDVTGFGILGHSNNLAQNQKNKVQFNIHTLPIIKKMVEIDKVFKRWRLEEGFSAETSGGLLVILPAQDAQNFCRELEELDGKPCWIVGDVIEAKQNNMAKIMENKRILEI